MANLNRTWYKILLILIKTIPYFIAVGYILYTIFSFIGLSVDTIGYFIHTSFICWVFIYLCSWVFEFCIVHRLPLYYILVNDIISIIDEYIGIPLSTFNLLIFHSVILGIFIVLYTILHVKNHKRITT